MKRYHKKVYCPENSKIKLQNFTDRLNTLKWQYTKHTCDNLNNRDYFYRLQLLTFIKHLTLNSEDIFEFYTDDIGGIIKVCYRVKYSENTDIILVMAQDKKIVTIYSNIAGDNHVTLKKELYTRG